jgi:DNA mismatch repair protein MutS
LLKSVQKEVANIHGLILPLRGMSKAKPIEEGGAFAETPLMKQYIAIKAKYPDALLLFRVGDFYETFGEDAIKASGVLGIVLTRRANGKAAYVELAGFPYHALDTYLPKLVRAGYKVAICDQLEDPKLTKTIVKRGVTELVTPGVSYNDKILDNKTNNFLAAVHLDAKIHGISFLDISTGEFLVAEGNTAYIEKLLQGFRPSEVVIQKNKRQAFSETFGPNFFISHFDDWVFSREFSTDILLRHFQTRSLKGFGVEDMVQGVIAAGACLHYLNETQHTKVEHITRISRIDNDHYVWLDRFSIRNLELLDSPNENASCLIDVLDRTLSPMGSRLMKRWMVLPLRDKQQIQERHAMVAYFLENTDLSLTIEALLKQIGDLERMVGKVATSRINPREVQQIKRALDAIEEVRTLCLAAPNQPMNIIGDQINPCQLIRKQIGESLMEDPPVQVIKGGVMATGVSSELDELRNLAYSGKDYLIQIQQRESDRTGIPSLKIGFNNVFGYYLEVRNTHKDKVPSNGIRKQTLVTANAISLMNLKEYEEKILGAEEKILALESRLFEELVFGHFSYIRLCSLMPL